MLLGMLAYNKEGKLCLEDADGVVELDFSTIVRYLLGIIEMLDRSLFRMSQGMAYLRKVVLPLSKESIHKKPPLKSWPSASRHANLETLQGIFLKIYT